MPRSLSAVAFVSNPRCGFGQVLRTITGPQLGLRRAECRWFGPPRLDRRRQTRRRRPERDHGPHPVHDFWLNQVEIYFSVMQCKLLPTASPI